MAASSAGFFSFPKPLFRPGLLFSDSLKTSPPPLFFHCSSSLPSRRPYSVPQYRSAPTLPFKRRSVPIFPLKLRSGFRSLSCFRCGVKGHVARSCSIFAWCYSCGILSHKSFACPRSKFEAQESPRFKDPVFGLRDDSIHLLASQVGPLVAGDDCMLYDTDVLGSLYPNSQEAISSDVVRESAGGVAQALKMASEGEPLGSRVLAEGLEDINEDMSDGPFSEHEGPDLITSFNPSQVSRLRCPSIYGAVPGMGKRIGVLVITRFDQRIKHSRLSCKGMSISLAANSWSLLMLGLESAAGSIKFNRGEEIQADSPTSYVPSLSSKVVNEAVSSYLDLPTIEEDISSKEEFNIPSSFSHEQVELKLDLFPLEGLLDIDIIDDLNDFYNDFYSDVVSPLKKAPVDGFNRLAKLSPLCS